MVTITDNTLERVRVDASDVMHTYTIGPFPSGSMFVVFADDHGVEHVRRLLIDET